MKKFLGFLVYSFLSGAAVSWWFPGNLTAFLAIILINVTFGLLLSR